MCAKLVYAHACSILVLSSFTSSPTEEGTEEPVDSDLILPVIYASTGGALVTVIVLVILVCVCCIALCRVKSKAISGNTLL